MMKHLMKRLGTAVMILTLALTALPAAVWADSPSASYLALGDSITAGYTPDWGDLKNPYTGYLRDLYALELKGISSNESEALAYSGWTTEDLLDHLNSKPDSAFAGARLVTITIGGNDLMGALYGYLFNEYKKASADNPTQYPDNYPDVQTFKAKIQSGDYRLLAFALTKLETFGSSAESAAALQTVESNLSAILTILGQKAPDAIVVVATQYNPYTVFKDNTLLKGMYSAFEIGVQQLNAKINTTCSGDKVVVADVYSVFNGQSDLCNAGIDSSSKIQLDFHPNEKGHKLMAKTFASAVDTYLRNGSSDLNTDATAGSFDSLTYGYTSAAPVDITLTNNGLLPVTVTGVSCDDNTHFTVAPASSSEAIAPGDSAVVATLTPASGLDADTYNVKVTVNISAAYPGSVASAVLDLSSTPFTGSVNDTASLEVGRASLSGATVTANGTFTYTGQAQTPSVTVTLGGKTLTYGTEYTTGYSGNINAGTATATVTGAGNYKDSASGSFTIQPAVLTIDSVSGVQKEYDGTTQGGSAEVTFGGLKDTDTLAEGTDYTLSAEFDDPGAGTGKTGTVTVTLTDTDKACNYTFADGTTAEKTFSDGVITKAAYTGTDAVSSIIGSGETYKLELPELPEGAAYGQPSSADPEVTALSVDGTTLSYTGGPDVQKGAKYTVDVQVTGASNYKDYTVTVTLTGCKILDPDKDQIKIKINNTIPQEAADATGYITVDAVKSELNRIPVERSGFIAGNSVCYDITLQYSEDGGSTWEDATSDNFPAGGIAITLPYPEDIDAEDYDFRVVHMFTVTSARLGTKAGATETPAVTEKEDGLEVTLRGLSPVTVGWKKTGGDDGDYNDDSDKEDGSKRGSDGDKDGSDASGNSDRAVRTGDSTSVALWAGLAIAALAAIAGLLTYATRKMLS